MEEKQFHISDTDSKEEKLLNDDEFRESLQAAVRELPDRARMVYTLHRQDGFKYDEIAEIMGISKKTVESQMSRVLGILRNKLKHFYYPSAISVWVTLMF